MPTIYKLRGVDGDGHRYTMAMFVYDPENQLLNKARWSNFSKEMNMYDVKTSSLEIDISRDEQTGLDLLLKMISTAKGNYIIAMTYVIQDRIAKIVRKYLYPQLIADFNLDWEKYS